MNREENDGQVLPMMIFPKPCMILTSKALNFLIFLICFSGFLFLLQCPSWKHRCFVRVFAALLSTQLTPGTLRRRGVAPVVLPGFWSWMNYGQETGESHFCWDRFGQMTFFEYIFVDFVRLLDTWYRHRKSWVMFLEIISGKQGLIPSRVFFFSPPVSGWLSAGRGCRCQLQLGRVGRGSPEKIWPGKPTPWSNPPGVRWNHSNRWWRSKPHVSNGNWWSVGVSEFWNFGGKLTGCWQRKWWCSGTPVTVGQHIQKFPRF